MKRVEVSASGAARLWGPLGAADTLPAGYGPALVAVLVVCFVARLGISWYLPSIHHADEVYQVAEPATEAARGYGVLPWEFRNRARAAVLPTLVEPIVRLEASAPASRALHAALFCGLSLIPVWVAFHWAGRLHGIRGAVLSAAIMAMWFELVYFAPKATADAVSSYFLLAGLFLARPLAPRGAVVAAGSVLIFTLALRVQIAPAVALALLLAALAGGRERWGALLAGVCVGLLVAGAIEWRWWGTPFQGQVGYLVMEFTRGSSQYFGREPLTFYLKQYVLMYGLGLPALAWLIYLGARRTPVLLVVALAVIVPFHFVGHKEYRFVVAALPMLVLLIGLAAAALCERLEARARLVLPLAVGSWFIAMVAVSFGDTYRPYWTRSGNHVLAFEDIGQQPEACGVALSGIRWWHTPGYSGLGRHVPIYEAPRQDLDARLLQAANYVLLAPKAEPPPPPYERWREYRRPVQYLYRRAGECVPDPSSQVRRPPGIPGVK